VSEPNNGNGAKDKVTLAVVQNEIVHLRADIQGFRSEVQTWRIAQELKVDNLDRWCTTSQERWTAHKQEHERENAVLKVWAAISAAIGGAVGGFFAWLASRS
jgi:hypothetical protein